jgi:hypothetical protein
MKALKWVGIGVGGFAALIGAIFAVVFSLTSGAASVATEFLTLVSESKYEEAYQATTPQFRKDVKLETFRGVIKLDKFESVSWNSREISGEGVKLEGTVRLSDGRTVVAIVKLEKIDDAWRVYSVTLRRPGVS